uniref:25S rRNA (uridine-N(3))-methyltransferase BMT5-like domain-containing protein n=1 Tax=Mycena chlorophos TaxID=658473 RepID=A0ABQ0MCH2_MYCCL|nr:predicted protein [Mycena chlorophos]
MAKSKKQLKAALQSQQSRLKLKDKQKAAAAAAQSAELAAKKQQPAKNKGKGRKSTTQPIPTTRRPTVPFRATDKILLIGEGNFSFARALVRNPPSIEPSLQHLPSRNVTATAYDTEAECYSKYPEAEEIVQDLRAAGADVLFGVDATRLERVGTLKGRRWDKIVWNFPHAGKGIADQDRNILSNQLLVLGFLRSAAGFLAQGPIPNVLAYKKRKRVSDAANADEDDALDSDEEERPQTSSERGRVLITLRNVAPYTQWDVPRLAKNPPARQSSSAPENPPYILLRSFVFHRDIWESYEHRMTKGERAHGTGRTGEGGEDRTWEFCLKSGS